MLIASTRIVTKLKQKHNVTLDEVEECISNLDPSYKLLTDIREGNTTIPPTLWFVSETNSGRILKVVVIIDENNDIHLKTAYKANPTEIMIYNNNR